MTADANLDDKLRACGDLLRILMRLRAPDGCPWDRKQTEETMAPLVLEEAYEMADAVTAGQPEKVAEEMGDLCMNVFMTALIAEEKGRFSLEKVFEKIAAKLVYRHPHVFGDESQKDVEGVLHRWEDLKRKEREAGNEDASAVAGVPRGMPGLLRAYRTAEKLRRTGADLPPFREPLGDASNLVEEMRRATGKASGETAGKASAEDFEDLLGRLLLALCNAASVQGVNPEIALRRAVDHELEVFRRVEAELGSALENAPAEGVDPAWQRHAGEGGDGRS